jgi:hypothetical protein
MRVQMLSNIVLFEGVNTTDTASLWETNGTTSGTFELTDVASPPPLITGEANYGFVPNTGVSIDLTVFNNQVLFAGRFSPTTPIDFGPYTLWTTDGTAAGTVPIPLTSIGASSSGLFTEDAMPGFTVFGDEVLFRGIDTGGASGLWKTNGTAAGTAEITGINGTASSGVNPTDITVFNDTALFNGASSANAAGPAGHLGLWTTNGTAGGTKELIPAAGAGAAATGLDPTDMTVFDGKVLFNGADANGLSGLWETDGTAAGTHEVLAAGGSSGLDPTDMTVVGGEVLFNGVDANGHSGLWITDGTAPGTREILAEAKGATVAKDQQGLNPTGLTVFNGEVFFTGFDQFGLGQLWETNGTLTGTQMLTVPGAADGLDPSNFELYDGQLLFGGFDHAGLLGLWTTNGTVAGTTEITPSSGTFETGLQPVDLTALTPQSSSPPPLAVTSSILFQNTGSGQVTNWEVDGSTLVGGGPVSPNPGPAWKAIGTGDFNKDGNADILWQNTSTGQASIWEMNGSILIGGGPVSPNPGPAWKAVGTGDFTDDGFSDDILWQNSSSGQVSVWEMSANKLVGGGPISPNPGPAWQAVGTGDFNKDGHSDILFQNTTSGQVSIWEMNANTLIGGGPVSPNPGPTWRAIGTGDFNHDGFSDILFQNKTTGQVSVWEMNGNSLIGGGPVSPNPGPSWHAIGTDGGGSDILFQNTSGQTSIWDMNGNTLIGGGPVSANPGTSWRAVGLT